MKYLENIPSPSPSLFTLPPQVLPSHPSFLKIMLIKTPVPFSMRLIVTESQILTLEALAILIPSHPHAPQTSVFPHHMLILTLATLRYDDILICLPTIL
jgi:hypothetical protein